MTCFYTLVGLLLAVTIVTFLRTVSLWSVLTGALVFLGMVLMFLLGAYVGQDVSLWRVGNPPEAPAPHVTSRRAA